MWLAWWAWAAVALAGDPTYYLETRPSPERGSVTSLASLAAEQGCRGDVVRRFVRDQGWRFVLRIETGGDRAATLRCAAAVPWPSAAGVKAYEQRDGKVYALGEEAGEPLGLADVTASAEQVLSEAVAAHTGGGAGSIPPFADAVLFRFTRRQPSGRVVEHTFARRGDDLYVETRVVEGDGVSTRAGVAGGVPWSDPKAPRPLDADTVRAQLMRFSPGHVLGVPLRFVGSMPEDREFSLMRVDTPIVEGTRVHTVLTFDGDRETPPVSLGVDAGTHLVQFLDVGTGGVVTRFRYRDYREIEGGAVVPGVVEVTREGANLDTVSVDELDLAPALLGEWFEVR